MRTFTTDGPCDPQRHYQLPAAPRLPDAPFLVDQGAYCLLRAPRRTGKTTTLRALASKLNAEGRFAALTISASIGEPTGGELGRTERALLASLRIAASHDLPAALRPPVFPESAEGTLLWAALDAWARVCPLPLVLLFDDVDTLHGAALRSLLRQLEVGFSRRPSFFPWSVVLSSAVDLLAERMEPGVSGAEAVRVGPPLPFDIAASSETLLAFTEEEVRALYAQHTAETGQVFEDAAVRLSYSLSAGHPFLVQALAVEATRLVGASLPITEANLRAASQRLLEKRISPIDHLGARLLEPRVRRLVEPLLAGSAFVAAAHEEDVQFARDIGLFAQGDPARIEGGQHQALVPQLLSLGVARAITEDFSRFFDKDGRLDFLTLLHAFTVFYATHGEELLAALPFRKIGPELILLGFLYRALEGHGHLDVVYGGLKNRIEVRLSVPAGETEQREVLVLVSRRKGDTDTKERGLGYLEDCIESDGAETGTLVVFDRREKTALSERVRLREAMTAKGRAVRLLRG